MVEAKMTERRILNKIPESELTNEDYANMIMFGLIGEVTESQASRFRFTTTVPKTSPVTETVNDTIIDDAGGSPISQPVDNQNNNNAHQGPHNVPSTSLRRRQLTSKNLSMSSQTKIQQSCRL